MPLGPSCSSSLLALSNNPLPFLDRASKWLTRRGSVTERPQRPTAPTRHPRPALGRTGTHWDAAVRGWTEGARAAGGTIFCLCSYFCAGRTNREVVFCSLIAAHKQRAEFSRRCSTGTEREVAGRGARGIPQHADGLLTERSFYCSLCRFPCRGPRGSGGCGCVWISLARFPASEPSPR